MLSFETTEVFFVPPQVIYDALLDAKQLTVLALGSPAEMEKKEGGKFSLFNGSIEGSCVQLEANRRIVQKWRFNDWPDGVFSNVDILIESTAKGESCSVHLKQTDIPSTDKFGNPGCLERCQQGWNINLWDRMEKVLGYGRQRKLA